MDVKRIVGWPRRLFLWPAVLAMGLAGCASTPPAGPSRPGAQGVARDDLRHYPLALGQVSTGAVPCEQPAPVYPPSLLDRRLPPREVLVRLIVDEQGRVSEVRMAGEAPADADTRLFDEAVRAAVMQWRFEPLRVNQWAADANGNTHVVGSETRPFSMDYVFRFAWKGGKPVTEASALPQSPK